MRNLASPRVIKEILSEYEFRFSKSLGQNFLVDEGALAGILSGADISEDDCVLEIGPGFGTLTQRLCGAAKKVVCVEIDKTVIPILEENLKDFDNFEIINDDVMKIDIKSLAEEKFGTENVKVAANLPYYITTPIIMMLLESKVKFKSITVMVQKEVAKRLCASEGTKDFGAISLAVQYFCNENYLFDVPNTSFMPPPKVTSTVVRLDLLDKPRVSVKKEEMFFKTVKASFAQRRKTLLNALSNAGFSGFSKAEISEILKNIGIEEKRRGETLSIDEFARLADALTR